MCVCLSLYFSILKEHLTRMEQVSSEAMRYSQDALEDAKVKYNEDPISVRKPFVKEVMYLVQCQQMHEFWKRELLEVNTELEHFNRQRKALQQLMNQKHRQRGNYAGTRRMNMETIEKAGATIDGQPGTRLTLSTESAFSRVATCGTYTPSVVYPVVATNAAMVPYATAPGTPANPTPFPGAFYGQGNVRSPYVPVTPAYTGYSYVPSFTEPSSVASPMVDGETSKPHEAESRDDESDTSIDVCDNNDVLNTPRADE